MNLDALKLEINVIGVEGVIGRKKTLLKKCGERIHKLQIKIGRFKLMESGETQIAYFIATFLEKTNKIRKVILELRILFILNCIANLLDW